MDDDGIAIVREMERYARMKRINRIGRRVVMAMCTLIVIALALWLFR